MLYCNTPIYILKDQVEDFNKLCTNKTPYEEWESLMVKYNLFEEYLHLCDTYYEHLDYRFNLGDNDPDSDKIDILIYQDFEYKSHQGILLLSLIISRFHTLLFDDVFIRLIHNPEYDVYGGNPEDTDDRGYLISPGQVRLVYKRWGEYDGPIKIEIK